MATSRRNSWPTAWARSTRADRKSTRLNSSHLVISYAVFCLKKKKQKNTALDGEAITGAFTAIPNEIAVVHIASIYTLLVVHARVCCELQSDVQDRLLEVSDC